MPMARLQYTFLTSFQLIGLVIPILLSFLQLQYKGFDLNTPFTSHPTTMHFAVFTCVLYYSIGVALLRFPPAHCFTALAHHFVGWCGYATVAALASVLLPVPFSPFIYAASALIAALELLCYFFCDEPVVEEEEGEEGENPS